MSKKSTKKSLRSELRLSKQISEDKDIRSAVKEYVANKTKIVDWGIGIVGFLATVFGVVIPILFSIYGLNLTKEFRQLKSDSEQQLIDLKQQKITIEDQLKEIKKQKNNVDSQLNACEENAQKIVSDAKIVEKSKQEISNQLAEIKKIKEQLTKTANEAKADAQLAKYNRLLFEADSSITRKDYIGAINTLLQALEIQDSIGYVSFELSNNYIILKDYDNAFKYIELALKKDKDNIFYYNSKALIFMLQNNYKEALKTFDEVILICEKDPGIIKKYNISSTNSVSHKYKEDGISFVNTVDLSVLYANKATLLMKLNKYDDAIVYYNKSLVLKPNDANILLGLGMTYYNQKVYVKAIEFLQQSIKYDDHDAKAFYFLGLSQARLEQFENAERSFSSAINLNSQMSLYWIGRATARINTDKYNLAKEDIDKAFSIEESSENYRARAMYYLKQFQIDQYNKDTDQAIKLSKDPADLYLGRILVNLYFINPDFKQIDQDIAFLSACEKNNTVNNYLPIIKMLVNFFKTKDFAYLNDAEQKLLLIDDPSTLTTKNNLLSFIKCYRDQNAKKSWWNSIFNF